MTTTPPAPATISPDDPRSPDVQALLTRHLELMHAQSDPEDVHALDVDALTAPHITFVSARDAADGTLLGVGALAEIAPGHGEIKSMHTAEAARRRGVAGALLAHLLGLAVDRGYARVSLETGSDDHFAAARALYARAGFEECPPFASYAPSDASTFMTLALAPAAR
ncbi:GNAT family N-acetyltransferase [Cellulomonas sp. IC4_254]|uniref:GNAT family N-acetyltransferase n=1 Tax=Cellulomonas sp. IC4_254 TaxID=2714040 RepID=UPI0014221F2E|nr:GNAT family N-acetyltransferase [Cellulomonas sp. IC4_254]NHT16792.1 GNAT family N-acetyltransferase [Cellulomonas sp. IC4_254]